MFGSLALHVLGPGYWNEDTVTNMWDGVWKELMPLLFTWTKYDDEREILCTRAGLGTLLGRHVTYQFNVY